jgi:DNA-3-methyladenine glycosylase I
VTRLLNDPAIIRNRAKITATITNARVVVGFVASEGEGALDALVWQYAPAPRSRPRSMGEVPASTIESKALAKALKQRGFVFVGPTTAYATMQACGLVDDHLRDCWVPPISGGTT